MDRNNILTFYDKFALRYDNYSGKKSDYLDAIDKLIIDRIKNEGYKNMLDIGTGSGTRILKIAKKSGINRLTITDPSTQMFKKCQYLKQNERIIIDAFKICAEDLDGISKRLDRFDAVTCLWNVMGHIADENRRIKALKNMTSLLNDNGRIFLDVNNRYNYKAYGLRVVLYNKIRDLLFSGEKNGDISYTININGEKIRGYGHVFTQNEIDRIIEKGGLKSDEIHFIDYDSGESVKKSFQGQLFYEIIKS